METLMLKVVPLVLLFQAPGSIRLDKGDDYRLRLDTGDYRLEPMPPVPQTLCLGLRFAADGGTECDSSLVYSYPMYTWPMPSSPAPTLCIGVLADGGCWSLPPPDPRLPDPRHCMSPLPAVPEHAHCWHWAQDPDDGHRDKTCCWCDAHKCSTGVHRRHGPFRPLNSTTKPLGNDVWKGD